MNCNKVQDLLSEAIDGTLPPSVARPFQDHIAACPPCRLLFADVKDSLSLLADLPAVEVGPEFEDAVFARLRAEGRATSQPRFAGAGFVQRWRESFSNAASWMRWAPLAAATALLAWVAVSHDTPGLNGGDAVVQVRGSSALDVRDAFTGSTEFEAGTNSEVTPVEYAAPMPEAVQVFLQSSRELRMNPDRYRRSSYHYPLRTVRDPLSVPVVPVSDANAVMQPGSADAIPVLTF